MSERIYAAQTVPGLEMVAWEEIQARLSAVSLTRKGRGLLLFAYDGPAAKLLSLRATEDVFAVIHSLADLLSDRRGLLQIRDDLLASEALEAALAAHRELHRRQIKRNTYRVVVQKTGQHAFRRIDAQEYVIKAVRARYSRWKLVEEDAHLEVWLHIQGRLAVSMIRLSDRSMRHRRYKLAHIPASLRPTVAYALVFLSEPEADEVFVDPMCGAGTIVIERALSGRAAAIIGGDVDREALAAAQTNCAPYAHVSLCRWDAACLPLPDGLVQKIVSNLPFGKQIGSPESNRMLYQRFFAEMDRVLASQGRAVLLSSERHLVNSLLKEGTWRSRRALPVTVLGQAATIYVLERVARDLGA